MACIKTQKWANMWGRVGLVGLSAKDPEHIKQYRNVIEQIEHTDLTFTIFPRDAIDKRGSVTVLLRETFRSYDPLCLPGSLFTRNKGLAGSLKVTHIKSYQESERTRGGQSKRDWRLILLQGCATFMKSLEQFDDDHKFSIGSGYVFIQGGVRRSRTEDPGQPPIRGPPRTMGRGAPRRGSDRNRATEQDYPRLPNSLSGRTGLGRGSGGGNQTNPSGPPRWGDRPGPSRRAGSTTEPAQ